MLQNGVSSSRRPGSAATTSGTIPLCATWTTRQQFATRLTSTWTSLIPRFRPLLGSMTSLCTVTNASSRCGDNGFCHLFSLRETGPNTAWISSTHCKETARHRCRIRPPQIHYISAHRARHQRRPTGLRPRLPLRSRRHALGKSFSLHQLFSRVTVWPTNTMSLPET